MGDEHWSVATLGDIAEIKTGKLDSNAAIIGGRFPFFTCSPETLKIDTIAFDCEAVILAGNNANGIFSVKYFDGKFNAYQRTYVITTRDCDRIDIKYLYYQLKQLTMLLQEYSIGTATKFLTRKILDPLPIPLPPLQTQRRIAHILGTLDDKIELNRRMNTTLEEMARTLFKSWFVDFDPVRAKMEGRQPVGMDAETAALFPDGFEDSELGEVPRGWGISSLASKIVLLSGGTPKTSEDSYWDGDIPWYSVKDSPTSSDVWVIQTEKHITSLGIQNSAAQIIPKGTTIISARGTVGKLALVGVPMAINQSCFGVKGKTGYGDYYTYYLISRSTADLQMRTHGSVFDTITRQTFETLNYVFPPSTLTLAFDKSVSLMLEQILANLHQSRTLATLRDTLLPKLMGGEVGLNDANL